MKSIHYFPEILDDPRLNFAHRFYIRIFGVPVSGLRIRLRRILPEVRKGMRSDFRLIADLGCGRGAFAFELAKLFPQVRVVGIDIDAEQIRINNQISRKNRIQNLSFEARDISDLEIEKRFDLILSVDNLEHMEDDRAALQTIRKALKPGGKLLCHVPAYERIWFFSGISVNFDVPGHFRPGYRSGELLEKLKTAGFQVEWVRPTYGYFETVSNNLSYWITGAEQRNALFYALAFPILNFMAWLGRKQKAGAKGAGLMACASVPAETG